MAVCMALLDSVYVVDFIDVKSVMRKLARMLH
jgi:hypothetical protein